MRILVLLLVVISFVVGGCAVRPSLEDRKEAYYGRYPENYKEIIKEHMASVMYDPSSASFSDWKGPGRGLIRMYSSAVYGFRVCVRVNGKNIYGGYAGADTYAFVVRDGMVVFDSSSDASPDHVSRICGDLWNRGG